MENKSEVLDPVAYKDGSVMVKLKIPKEEGLFSDQNHHHQIMKNGTESVCYVCHRMFSSGKALGGHMRIHVQQAKKNDGEHLASKKEPINFKKQNSRDQEETENSIDCDIMMKKRPICAICGRDFPSMKSLSGHLRCHPDRGWRGIQPPQSGKDFSSSFSPSSSLSDVELSSEIEDRSEVLVDDEGKKGIVNLSESLSIGWAVTARRGRTAAAMGSTSEANSSSEGGELLLIAAHVLMMLSRGLMNDKRKSGSLAEAPKSATDKILQIDSVSESTNKRKIDEVEKTIKLVCYSSDDDEDDAHKSAIKFLRDHNEDDNTNLKGLLKSKKRIRKRVKLSDLDHQMSRNVATPWNDKAGAATGDKYSCDTCDKSFPTYQALGGHMSRHNKFKLVNQNSITKPHNPGVQIKKPEEHEKNLSTDGPLSQVASSEICRRVLDFDLNKKLPSEDEEA